MATQLTVILSSGSLVDIDATLFIQLGIFLFMLVVLRFLLFKPVIRLIEARREATVGAMENAASLQKEAASLSADFNVEVEKVRAVAAHEKNAIVTGAKQKEREILDAAKARTEQVMTDIRAKAEAQMQQARQALESETRVMASLLVEKVLDRKL
jgi:F-type H+-transporting ATPase subunit b